jgi:hypothetical protein
MTFLKRAPGLLLILMATLQTGCISNGPKVVGPAQFDYNQTVATSFNEQLLLNLVRLHYRDTPMFLKVDQVVAGYTFETQGSANLGFLPSDGGIDQASGGIRGTMTERPTITMSPLQDRDFTSRLLAPISSETLLLLAASGWQIERVMMCGVREINGLRNVPATLDADLIEPKTYPQFCDLAKQLEKLQRSDDFRIRVTVGEDGQSQLITSGAGGKKLHSLFGLPANNEATPLTPSNAIRKPEQLDLEGRSLLDVMTFLSRSVEAPQSHIQQGLVVDCRKQDSPRSQNLIRIASSKTKPRGSIVTIRYRDHWFSLPNNDLDAKETFGLLTQPFSLQASKEQGRSPLLTIPTG